MYEKILQKLKDQREALNVSSKTISNVSDRSLDDLAKALSTVISTDELLALTDLTAAIASIDGNINHYTAKQVADAKVKIAAENKATEEKAAADKLAAEKKEKPDPDPEKPDIAKLIQDAIQPLVKELNGFKDQKVTQSRSDILTAELKETPEIFRNATLGGFKRMAFDTEEEFTSYIEEVKVSAKEAIQVGLEKGLNINTPAGDIKKPDAEAVSPEMTAAIKEVTKVDDDKKPY